MEYYSSIKKDGIALMDLEIITVSEISLTDKDKYHDITYTQKVKKKKKTQMNLFTKQKQTHRLREFTVTSREGRQRGTDWELGIDVYTLLYLK